MGMLLILLMLVAGAGMVVGLLKHRSGETWGRPLAIGCALVALACAAGIVGRGGGGTDWEGREEQYQRVAGEKLGQYLAETMAGAKAVLILEPEGPLAGPGATIAEGLKRGFADAITVVGEERPPAAAGAQGAPDPAMMGPISTQWLTSRAFNSITDKYKGKADLLVTTVGLPTDLSNLSVWEMEPPMKVALAAGAIARLAPLLQRKYVIAAVTPNPNPGTRDEKVPPDLEEAFQQRYLLLTPQNAGNYPKLFVQ